MSNYELKNHKKSDKIKWFIAFTLIAIILFGMVGGMLYMFNKNNEKANVENTNPTEENVGVVEGPIQPIVTLAATAFTETYAENGTKSVTKTLTATVLPTDAPDKSLDWEVMWCVPIEGEDVTDYITVVPTSDGALTAKVTAHKAFEGASAYVTATTRVGGFSAQCLVIYDGKPESFTFICNGKEYSNTSTLNTTAGETYSVKLNLNNALGSVGSEYGDFEIVSIKGLGRFTLKKEYIVNASVASTEDVVFNLETGSYSYKHEVSGETETLTITPDQFFTASISGDIMTINVIKSESSYINGYPRTGYRFSYNGTYTDPRSGGVPDNCMWYISVRDKVSGESALLHIDIQSTVTSISLSNSTLSF